jgi:ABC-type multidrug transport system ATPase subunit
LKKLFDGAPPSIQATDVAINISHVDKTFHGEKETHALNNFSLEIKQGEIIILIGPNGCGKTTLISAITSAQSFDSGEIDIYENNIEENPNAVKSVGVVFQESVFVKEITARENLKFFGTLRGLTKSLESDITYLADQIGLTHCLDSESGSMSGGEKRKLSILIALIQKPQILVLDEPTAGVDAAACHQIWKVINSYKDTTSLISAHALEEAESVCSKIIVMQNGELKFGGSPTELREQTGCGYKLSVENDDYQYQQLLDFVKQYQPSAKVIGDEKCIFLPNDFKTADAIIAIDHEKERLGITSYNVHVENLEDNLIKFIAEHENL